MQIKFGKLEHVRMSLFNKENHYMSLRKRHGDYEAKRKRML